MSEEGLVGGIGIGVPSRCLGVPRWTVAAGVHVRWTARQNEGVESFQLFFELLGRLIKFHFLRVRSGLPGGLEVIIELVPLPLVLFLGSAPGDAHTGARGGARLGISRGHGT